MFNNQFATQKLREETETNETSVSSGVGVYHKKKGERTTGGMIYKDLWKEEDMREIFSKEDYEKVVQLLDKIIHTDPKAFYAILQKVTSNLPHTYDDVKNLAPQVNEDEENDYWTNKEVKIIKGKFAGRTGETIGGGNGTVDVKITSYVMNPIVTLKQDEVKVIGDLELNENYSRFKKETRVKTGTKQYYEGIKIAERKLKEANKVLEYISKLKTELSETNSEIKENSHITKTKSRMVKAIAELYSKFKSF
jgi:hypothetical protein